MTICKIIYNQPQAQSNFSIFMCDLDTWLIRERGNIKGYTVINSIDSIYQPFNQRNRMQYLNKISKCFG